jgi:Protein of unknown function (DUF3592)
VGIFPHQSRRMNPKPAASPPQRRQGSGQGGRWFLVGLGLVVALIGALFVTLLGRSFLRAREMRTWPEVPCVILTSEIEERVHDPQSPTEYRHVLSFGYEWQGEARTGDRLSLRGSPWSSKQGLVGKRAAEFPTGKRTTCRVNPGDPDFAVLKPDSLAPGYSIWFPGLFVIGGLGIALRALISPEKGGASGRADRTDRDVSSVRK